MIDDFIYVFLHIEKTGGTTINAHLADHLGWDEGFVHLGPWGDNRRAQTGTPQPRFWSQEKRSGIRVLAGHRTHVTVHRRVEGKTPRYFTILRDPATMTVSQYNYDASRTADPPAFWDWYAQYPRNPAFRRCRHMLGAETFDEVVTILKGFWFVGTTEGLNQDLPSIFREIGVPEEYKRRRVTGSNDLADIWPPIENGVATRHITLTEAMAQQIRTENDLDRRLHQFAERRRQELCKAYGWSSGPPPAAGT